MKLYLPGLAEYAHCKAQFQLAEKLLGKADEHKTELSGILQTLDNNPDAVDFLKAEFKDRYRQVYEKLTTISAPEIRLAQLPADNGNKKMQQELLIPVYRDLALSQVANSFDGLKYLQTLYDTKDDSETIMQTLEFISGKNRTRITVCTPATGSGYTRISDLSQAVGFGCGHDGFYVNGYGMGGRGRSRGVDLVFPKGTRAVKRRRYENNG